MPELAARPLSDAEKEQRFAAYASLLKTANEYNPLTADLPFPVSNLVILISRLPDEVGAVQVRNEMGLDMTINRLPALSEQPIPRTETWSLKQVDTFLSGAADGQKIKYTPAFADTFSAQALS